MSGQKAPQSELERRLLEAEETLSAICSGEADGVVVDGAHGQQIYTLENPDQPFRVFVERMRQGAVTVDDDFNIIYANGFFADLLGRPLERVFGASLLSFVAPENRQDLKHLLSSAEREPQQAESALLDADGQPVPVQIAVGALPNLHTPALGLVVSDLTHRRRVEKLEIARQAAENANAARDQFLATVSHELRSPLTAVVGWAQVLRQMDDLPEKVSHGLGVIERNARAQTGLINDLLDVSRVLVGKLRLSISDVRLSEALDGALKSVTPAAEAKGITLEALIAEDVVLRGDADRLQQVTWNLLSNAVKYTSKGGKVTLQLTAGEDWCEIKVSDTGRGFPPEFADRLFGMFQQEETSPSRTSGGLGLGLAIVRQLTHLHGGDVRAYSAGTGKGATFTIRLPRAGHSGVAQAGELMDYTTNGADLHGIRVLAVEDEDDARELIALIVEQRGGVVIPAGSAQEAMERLESDAIDVLVSDIGLPGIDGYELIRMVRVAGFDQQQLPALALTAFASRDDRRKSIAAGYQEFLAKPVDQHDLCNAIARLAASRTPR